MSDFLDKNFDTLTSKPKLGVSACLMGLPVRFDGGHKQNDFILNYLSDYVEYESLCPEVEAGFSTPRDAMQLTLNDKEIKLVISKDNKKDVSQTMRGYANKKVSDLSELDGFIFKKNSPSCGVHRVPVVINQSGYRRKIGRGIFSGEFMKRYPLIPVEEEGRLHDAGLRENFVERVFSYRRWKAADNNIQGLIKFHSRHKLMLMARGSHHYQKLGRIVAGARADNLDECRDDYINQFMQVLTIIPSPGRQVNVLLHILGYFKKVLSREDKKELLDVFEAYRQRQLPLITPITLLRHYLRLYPQEYIAEQHYLEPCPEQLALRSVV